MLLWWCGWCGFRAESDFVFCTALLSKGTCSERFESLQAMGLWSDAGGLVGGSACAGDAPGNAKDDPGAEAFKFCLSAGWGRSGAGACTTASCGGIQLSPETDANVCRGLARLHRRRSGLQAGAGGAGDEGLRYGGHGGRDEHDLPSGGPLSVELQHADGMLGRVQQADARGTKEGLERPDLPATGSGGATWQAGAGGAQPGQGYCEAA